MDYFFSPFLIAIVAICAIFAYAIVGSVSRARLRELEVRERIALIERGLVPSPEVDPRGFDRAMSRYTHTEVTKTALRYRRAGVTLVGIGLGLMLLIGTAGESPAAGVGVGGFIALVGGAFLINSMFEMRHHGPVVNGGSPAAPPPPGAEPIRHDS